MDIVLSALVSVVVSRSISSVIAKYQRRTFNMNKLARLEQMVLRAHTLVEEAEGRHVSNQRMLLKLKQLKKDMYRGYYVLDIFKRPVGVSQPSNLNRVHFVFESLEASIDDIKEFLACLVDCPPIFRQPYSAYLFMETCMFGRHTEKYQVINFLLQPCDSSPGVLPIIGPPEVGKRTLVEHVFKEERVCEQFSKIVRISSDDLNQLATDGVICNRELVVANARSVIVAEISHNIDDATWRLFHSLIRHKNSDNSKIIIISAIEEVSRLGTTQAVKLKLLSRDEYWYFFKTIAFGSANPDDHHQLLLSIGRKIITHTNGSFIAANVLGRLLQANLSAKFWRYVLDIARKNAQCHLHVFGEYAQDRVSKNRPFYISNLVDGPLVMCYQRYEIAECGMQSELPKVKGADLITRGNTIPAEGKFELLRWQSTILPYHSYIARCVVQDPQQVERMERRQKRKRWLR